MTVPGRHLFRVLVTGGVAASLRWPPPASAQTTLTQDAALQTLLDGNARFTAGRLSSFQEDLVLRAQKTAEKQEPFTAVLSCADSRVPVELLSTRPSATSS